MIKWLNSFLGKGGRGWWIFLLYKSVRLRASSPFQAASQIKDTTHCPKRRRECAAERVTAPHCWKTKDRGNHVSYWLNVYLQYLIYTHRLCRSKSPRSGSKMKDLPLKATYHRVGVMHPPPGHLLLYLDVLLRPSWWMKLLCNRPIVCITRFVLNFAANYNMLCRMLSPFHLNLSSLTRGVFYKIVGMSQKKRRYVPTLTAATLKISVADSLMLFTFVV